MAKWERDQIYITVAGQELVNRSATGDGRIEITRVTSSSARYDGSSAATDETLVDVKAPVQNFTSVSWHKAPSVKDEVTGTVQTNRAFVLEAQLNNKAEIIDENNVGVDEQGEAGYYLQQIGVFARFLANDGTVGDEVLMVLAEPLTSTADWVSTELDSYIIITYALQFNLFDYVGNNMTVNITMNNTGMVSQVQMERELNRRYTNPMFSGNVVVNSNGIFTTNQNGDLFRCSLKIPNVKVGTPLTLSRLAGPSAITELNDAGQHVFYARHIEPSVFVPNTGYYTVRFLCSGDNPQNYMNICGQIVKTDNLTTYTNSGKLHIYKADVYLTVGHNTLSYYSCDENDEFEILDPITSPDFIAVSVSDGEAFNVCISAFEVYNTPACDSIAVNQVTYDRVPWETPYTDVSFGEVTVVDEDLETFFPMFNYTRVIDEMYGGYLSSLATDNKSSYVAAINELYLDLYVTDRRAVEARDIASRALQWKGWCKGQMEVDTSGNPVYAPDNLDDYVGFKYIGYWAVEVGDQDPEGKPISRLSSERLLLIINGIGSLASDKCFVQTLHYTGRHLTYRRYYGYSSTTDVTGWSPWKRVAELPTDHVALSALESEIFTGTKIPVINSGGVAKESSVAIDTINTQNGNGFYFPDPEMFTFNENGWGYKDKPTETKYMSAMCCWNGIDSFMPYGTSNDYYKGLMPPHNPVGRVTTKSGYALLNIGPKDSTGLYYTRNLDVGDPTTLVAGSHGEYVYNTSTNMVCGLSLLDGLRIVNTDSRYTASKNYKLTFELSRTDSVANYDIVSLFGGSVKIRYASNQIVLTAYKNANKTSLFNDGWYPVTTTARKFTFTVTYISGDTGCTLTLKGINGSGQETSVSVQIAYTLGEVELSECKLTVAPKLHFWGVGESVNTTFDGDAPDCYGLSNANSIYRQQVLSHFLPNQGVLAQLTSKWLEARNKNFTNHPTVNNVPTLTGSEPVGTLQFVVDTSDIALDNLLNFIEITYAKFTVTYGDDDVTHSYTLDNFKAEQKFNDRGVDWSIRNDGYTVVEDGLNANLYIVDIRWTDEETLDLILEFSTTEIGLLVTEVI